MLCLLLQRFNLEKHITFQNLYLNFKPLNQQLEFSSSRIANNSSNISSISFYPKETHSQVSNDFSIDAKNKSYAAVNNDLRDARKLFHFRPSLKEDTNISTVTHVLSCFVDIMITVQNTVTVWWIQNSHWCLDCSYHINATPIKHRLSLWVILYETRKENYVKRNIVADSHDDLQIPRLRLLNLGHITLLILDFIFLKIYMTLDSS